MRRDIVRLPQIGIRPIRLIPITEFGTVGTFSYISPSTKIHRDSIALVTELYSSR